MRMKNANLMLSDISKQLPQRSCIKPLPALQAKPPDILFHQISERAVAPGRAKVRDVLLTRQDIHQINSHTLSAAGIQCIR